MPKTLPFYHNNEKIDLGVVYSMDVIDFREILNEKPLKILNASAGSGKTYHLVLEYIKLLIRDDGNHHAFSHVIAMTFTNKAALEMKERIIEALDKISAPQTFKDEGAGLTSRLSAELGISTEEVIHRCTIALEGILHNYEDFHVMTIDKFNLRLIKSFGRDLDLPNEFEVVLDESELIESIVDNLLNQLGSEGSSALNKLVLRYAKNNIDEGLQWNFRRSLVEFAGILKNERNNATVKRLLEIDLSTEQFGRLKATQSSIDKEYTILAAHLLETIEREHLTQDELPGKSRTFNPLMKLAHSEAFPDNGAPVTDAFLTNMDSELKPGQRFPSSVIAAVQALVNYWESHQQEYGTLVLYLKNFFNMALLQFLAEALQNVRKEEQLIRISEFNTLIAELIQFESAPFIYERLGTKFHHFLLDEFQDTSRLQWLNLVPLVKESLSQNKENFIVGDPKQSIYRFKNGVAEQFVALPNIYNPEENAHIQEHSNYFQQMGSVNQLDENWRSSPTIVTFNNTFFTELRNILPENTSSFYNAIKQTPKSTINGRVEIISKEEKRTATDLTPQIIEWIEACLADGFQPGELCILGNTNRECNAWAIGLTEKGYKVVSTDSLLINSSLKVQLTIAYLRRRLNPTGENEMKRFAELYFRIHATSPNDYHHYIEELEGKHGRTYRKFDDERFLQDQFDGSDRFFYKHESIYDLIEQFYAMIGYNELSDPYLHHLADIAFDFGLVKGPDLRGFLSDYATKKNKIAVQIPESSDAIQLMTIHKSKGLEFPVVIVPSMNFAADVKSHFLVDLEDYIIYKKPAKSDYLSVLQDLYNQEKEQVLGDNVNKCYVALTRPVERLYVANYFEKSKFGEEFHQVLEATGLATTNDDTLVLSINDGARNQTVRQVGSNVFEPINLTDLLWFPDIALQDNTDLYHDEYLSTEMQYGIQFHVLASRINSLKLIDAEIDRGILEGEIDERNSAQLKKDLIALLSMPSYAQLFEGKTNVLSEQSIILESGELLRPDKIILKHDRTIVIDYKTGLPKEKDLKQINTYKAVLGQMNYPSVECYIYYASLRDLRLV